MKQAGIEKELTGNISVSVPLDTYLTIKRMSKVQRRSMSETVRGIIEMWLDNEHIERYTFISETEKARMREELRAEVKKELQKEMELTLF